MAGPVKPNYDNVKWGGPDGLRIPTEVTTPNLYLAAALFPIVYIFDNAALGFAVFNSAAAVTILPATALTGTYRISFYMVPTTTFATSTEEVITFGWTDDKQAQTAVFTSSAESAGTITQGDQMIRTVTGTAVTWTPSVTGSAATAGVMAISIVAEKMI